MTEIRVSNGYTRRRHWEIIYHDLLDLYGPMIGLEGVGLWTTYQRHVQNDPEHILADRAWPSHRGLAGLYRSGRKSINSTRRRLQKAGLISVKPGRDLAKDAGLSLSHLAQIGIQNPASTLFIRVNAPLEFQSFCDKFGYRYRPIQLPSGHWNMAFKEYPGRILGPNRLLAATTYLEEHIEEVSAAQIRSLLRCSPKDQATIKVRSRLLQRHEMIHGPEVQRRHTTLPDQVLAALKQLGWQGSLEIVEEAFTNDSSFAWQQIDYWLEHQEEVENAAAALRESLKLGADKVDYDEFKELEF
jgi:hypothetical protein